MPRYVLDILTVLGGVALLILALVIGDLLSRSPELIGRSVVAALDWRDARRKPRQWQPGGYRVKGVRRT